MNTIVSAFRDTITEIDADLTSLNELSEEEYHNIKNNYISKYDAMLMAIGYDIESQKTAFIEALKSVRTHVNMFLATFLILRIE